MPVAASAATPTRAEVTLPGHTIPLLQKLKPLGATNGNRVLSLSIALNLRNQSALDALLAAQNDPQSPHYHQYLTPRDFAAEFAPTSASVNAVVAYLRGQGLTVKSVAANHLLIDAVGTVAAVQRAFHVRINDYALTGHTVYAPANDPAVPASLQGIILNIGGLDDVAQYHPMLTVANGNHGSGPGGGYTPSELRTAYDLNPLLSTANGAGQTVAIFELDGYKSTDVNAYLSYYNLGAPNYTNVLIDGATTTAGAGAIEVELDMEVVSAIAPGAAQKIYIGPNTTQGVNDTYNQIVTDNVAKVASTSWGLCEAYSGNAELAALDAIFKQGAAQGQTLFAAAGDAGAYDCGSTSLGVDSPADDPNVVGVGGTNLQTGNGGTYTSESVWACSSCTQGAPKGDGGGGGLSSHFSQPAYQTGPGVSNAYSNGSREVPDVAADADPQSGYSVYCSITAAGCSSGAAAWLVIGGTSAATPLWAALAADTNGYLAAQSKPTLGNANATLYRLFNTAQTYPAYHDVTSGNNLHYPATTGYDLASGIGTPDGWNLARDAAGATTPPSNATPTITSFTPTSGPVGTSVTLTGTNLTGATAVTFNGTSASFTVTNATTITATVPTNATTGALSVTTTAGTATATTNFTVTTPSQPATTQLLVNAGFENGPSPWLESSKGGYQLVDPLNPHTGRASAWLCGYTKCNDTIWQQVTLPASSSAITLSYWLYVDTSRASPTCLNTFNVWLLTKTGSIITTVQTKCNASVGGWTQYTFTLTSALAQYKGQTVQLVFQGTTTSLTTDFFVDDVALNATR
jgi:kumamolisin